MSIFNMNYHRIASINLLSYQEYDIFIKSITWILKDNLDLAYRLCCRFNAEIQENPGIGCHWSDWWRKGIPLYLEDICNNVLCNTKSRFTAACAIYLHFSGIQSRKISVFIDCLYEEHVISKKPSLEHIRYVNSYISCECLFHQYSKTNMRTYIFLATLDNTTCPLCGKLDGQCFPISERKLGVNCPPMHIGCRCTTISQIPPNATRNIWNPITRKSENIPFITYTEWDKKYNKIHK